MPGKNTNADRTGWEIAIIGMAGRFPGARNLEEFWENLKNGMESISFFSDEELKASGISQESIKNPNYIKARGIIEDIEYFDSSFFGYTPMEAEVMDPQLRICHEYAWEALEDAGYNPDTYDGRIGFYAGASPNLAWEAVSFFTGMTGEEAIFSKEQLFNKDYLSMRICYNLNLTGPGITINTTCSTSLVAIDMAVKGLLTGQCDMALAGGITVTLPAKRGYFYQDGMVLSPDGHVRTFDALATGTNGGDGVGIVVLKALEDAIKDRDHIYAVIKSSATNNDGKRKVGFTAPSVEGQEEVIRSALHMAEVEPESIGYIEAHGTGTPLGDPIEIEALMRAFDTEKKKYCMIGSVKTNVGHLDSAAGVASFIKAVLTLKHKQIPPSLNFESANPKIDIENSPFRVANELTPWKNDKYPLRAGVSSFGIGGTNAHVVLEEAPPLNSRESSREARNFQLILLSAKTQSALDRMTGNFICHLKKNPGIDFADTAYTLIMGRGIFKYRKMTVAADIAETIDILSDPNSWKVHEFKASESDRPVVFMFSGQGQQYVDMGLDLYREEAVFRQEMDRCFGILKPLLGYDIKEILYPAEYASSDIYSSHAGSDQTDERIYRQDITQAIMFVIEYAMARLLMDWGIRPYAMIGYSIGEYVAATLSGVFTLEDALPIVALRGKLMEEIPGGLMVSVPLTEKELISLLKGHEGVSIAVVNGPSCIVSGTVEDVQAFQNYLKKEKHMICMSLNISHAGHSKMMDPMMEKFHEELKQISYKKPEIPYISTLTGRWITVEEAADPLYWTRHLRETVRFAQGMEELLKVENAIFVELGPGRSLSTAVMQHPHRKEGHVVLDVFRYPNQNLSDVYYLMNKIGRLWLCGKRIDWKTFYKEEIRQRIPLPRYPFDKYVYGVNVDISVLGKLTKGESGLVPQEAAGKQADIADWFYLPSWKPSMLTNSSPRGEAPTGETCWLVFMNNCRLANLLVEELQEEFPDLYLAIVEPGSRYSSGNNGKYTIVPGESSHYELVMDSLQGGEKKVTAVLHLWNIDGGQPYVPGTEWINSCQDVGYYSLIDLARALSNRGVQYNLKITVLSDSMQGVPGTPLLYPEKATLLGPVQIIPREYPNISCRSVDIVQPTPGTGEENQLIHRLIREITAESTDNIVAYRGNQRLVQTFEPFRLDETGAIPGRLKENGVYLITGGLGGVGLELAQYLAEAVKARLVLVGRSSFPAREEWEQWVIKNKDTDVVSQKIRKLQAMEECGAEVMVSSADVSDYRQMETVFCRVKERFGSIDGIVHCALNLDGSLIHRVTREITDRVFASKVKGTLVLRRFAEEYRPDFFILCSSLSSILGNAGEVVYCASNHFQDALAYQVYTAEESDPSKQTYTAAINWDAWQEVGGAVETVKRMIKSQLKSTMRAEPVKHPLLQSRIHPGPDKTVYISRLTPSKYWPLDEHRVKGEATLPGTAYLEIARAAFENQVGSSHMEIRDLYLISPLMVRDNEEKEVQTILEKQGEEFEFRIISRERSMEDRWQEHARGKISGTGLPKPRRYRIEELESMCPVQDEILSDEGKLASDKGPTSFGPRWIDSMKKTKYGDNGQLSEIELGEAFIPDIEVYKVHPALLDCALAVRHNDGFHIPFFYKKIRIQGSLPAKVFSHITYSDTHKVGSKTQTYNVAVMDEQGMERLMIEEYSLMNVSETVNIDASSEAADASGTDSLESSLLKKQLQNGILSAEGVEVFKRVLEGTLPRYVISTQGLKYRLQEDTKSDSPGISDILEGDKESTPMHSRPELSTKYAAPSSETEKTLAEAWEKFLGIDRVGINDNFFELGATSLAIVQISSLLKDKLGLDISIINMYTYPTVNQLAQFLDQGKTLGEIHAPKAGTAAKRSNVLNRRKANIKGGQYA